MNRMEFLQRLEQALRGMPEEERRRAMEYYKNYFDEAGPENEAEVLRTLGAPEKVAADILREFKDTVAAAGGSKTQRAQHGFHSLDNGQKLLVIVLAIIAMICIAPISLGLFGGIGGVLFALICVVATIFTVIPLLSIAAWGCAIGFLVAGIVNMMTMPPLALLFFGVAMICAAIGLLLWQLTVYLFRTTFPALLNGIAGIFRRLFHPRQGG